MPSCSRRDIVCPEEVGVYHCWSRCVRRAFLCGHDPVTGTDYQYRRLWVYVDLNQIRVGEASTPESSRHTSAYDRICARQQRQLAQQGATDLVPIGEAPDGWMCELTLDQRAPLNDPRWLTSASARRASDKGLLPVRLDDYLQLLDASGRIVREGKSGAIPSHLQPILDRLGIRPEMWSALVTGYDEMFGHVVGGFAEVSQRAARAGRRWCRGQSNCAAAFTS